MIPIFELQDGTSYTPADEWWEAAVLSGIEAHLPRFRAWFAPYVAGYWDRKQKRTKFGDESWEEPSEFPNHAALAENLFYHEFRSAILGLVVSRASGGKTHVIGLNRDGTATKFSDQPAESLSPDWLAAGGRKARLRRIVKSILRRYRRAFDALAKDD